MKSTVQTKQLTKQYNVVNIDKSTYILLRNLGAQDVNIETQYGGIITLRTKETIQRYAPVEFPIVEVWRAYFPNGESLVEILYTYQGRYNNE